MELSLVLCVLLSAVFCARAQLSSTVLPSDNSTVPYTTTPGPTSVPATQYSTPNSPVTSISTTPVSTTPQPTSQKAPLTPSQIMCHAGWEFFQGRCYYFVNEGLTWPQAQSNCAMLGSMLASVHSVQEYGFLQQLSSNNGWGDTWLGGFYLQDQWLWLDGSWFYNISWTNQLPDSSNPCLMLTSNESWSNTDCNVGGMTSICVKNSNVPPAMVCPSGWTGFQGRCYYYNSAPLTWPDADANCARLEASLVSVHSPEEYFFLNQQSSNPAWLGGFYVDDQWMWLDGSWFYDGFFSMMSSDNTDQCLSTYTEGGWSNNGCNQALPSVCVMEALSYLQQ